MIKHIFWSLAICLVSLFVLAGLIGCKGTEGPAGPAGKDASVSALEGFKDSIQCANCHDLDKDTTIYLTARELQWQNSGHNSMGDYDENRGTCAVCHTTEGFIMRMKDGNSLTAVTDRPDPTPVGCFACHSPHLNGNFSLRVSTPVTLVTNITGVPDVTFDDGSANLCAQCHQPRSTSPKLDISKQAATDSLMLTSNRWSPHHGVQSMLLKGSGTYYEWPGYTYGNSAHQTLAAAKSLACPDCHMAKADPSATNAGRVGGHTMNIAFDDPATSSTTYNVKYSCNTAKNGSTCHSAGTAISGATTTPLEHNGNRVKAVIDSMTILYNQLVALNYIDPATGLVKATSSAPLKIKPAKKAGALWNYLTLAADKSNGIHNTQYALDLLTASLDILRKN